MKGQISPISMVLITGVVLSLVGAAYFWGVPLIEKRSTVSEYETARNFMENLNQVIKDIANSGGKESLDIPLGSLSLKPEGEGNSLTMELVMKQPIVSGNSTIYLGDTTFADAESEVGVFGESSSSILSLKAEKSEAGKLLTIELHYRELDTKSGTQGYKIALDRTGASSGTDKISIEAGETETLEGEAANGGDLVVTHVNVELK